jgi:hypothetical protein
MLASLRDTFNKRIPGGLTPVADKRLQRSLEHFTTEVKRVHGTVDEQTVLRETYDSMTKWYRQHTTELAPAPASRQQIDPLKRLQHITDADPKSIFAPAMTGDSMVGSGGNSMAAFGSTAFDMMAGGSGRVLDTVDSAKMNYNTTDNPLALYERIKAMRDTAVVAPTGPTEMPIPTELQPIETRPTVDRGTVQPKDFITPQEDVIKYRETEYNLVLNSKDRNWLVNTKENRYDFSIQLDSARWPQGAGPQPTIATRFRNIVRVEFIKALLPVEGLDIVMLKNCETGINDPTSAFYSAMALPFVNVILDEIDGNTVGTSNAIDRSLAICQYDATWRTDHLNNSKTTNRGYTLFFPKFMKAQRVYAPAPLASFQKLGFQLVGPEGLTLSKSPDSNFVSNIMFGFDVSGSCFSDHDGSYIFIKTKEWFPVWSYSQLDKVEFRGLTFSSSTPGIQTAATTLIDWLQRDQGHIVIGIAHSVADVIPDYEDVQDGANSAGYANFIIVRNRFNSPATTGVEDRYYFTESESDEQLLSYELHNYPANYQEGGVLNLSRQVQLVLRVVTREMDHATNTRPDNV